MSNPIDFNGQWVGHFAYGSEYGDDLFCKKVRFRLFIDSFTDGHFTGRSIDFEGIGAIPEIAQVKGYTEDDSIVYSKIYPCLYKLDKAGNTVADKNQQHPKVVYFGDYNSSTGSFAGHWELRTKVQVVGEYWLNYIFTGTWDLYKDE